MVRALLCALPWLAAGAQVGADDTPQVAAAASVKFALDEIVAGFQRATGRQVRMSYGASGNFKRQIVQGAPFELFLSADEDYVLALHRERRTLDAGKVYALGRVVLFAPTDSPLQPAPSLQALARALVDERLGKFAIANPRHAPYGRAAREILEGAGLWSAIAEHLVLGENAGQATQFAISGSTSGGMVPLALALAPPVSIRGSYAVIDATRHRPLRHRMALLKGAGETARELYDHLLSVAARDALLRHGFDLPVD